MTQHVASRFGQDASARFVTSSVMLLEQTGVMPGEVMVTTLTPFPGEAVPGEPLPPAFYQHTQVLSASSWLINHNLGFKPNVSVSDLDGVVIQGSIIHHSIDQLELQFNQPRAGEARLS